MSLVVPSTSAVVPSTPALTPAPTATTIPVSSISSAIPSGDIEPPATTGKVPITVEVPWEGELPNSTGLVCRSNEDLFTHLCCADAGGKVQARPYSPGDEAVSGSASDAASSAAAASGSLAARDATAFATVSPAGMLVALCALPAENGSAFDACTQKKAATWRTNATTMCYDPNPKESRGVRLGVGMAMLGALAASVLVAV